MPLVVVSDGKVLEQNLRARGVDRTWLERTLKEHGLKLPQDVLLMTVDEQGQAYVAPREKEGAG